MTYKRKNNYNRCTIYDECPDTWITEDKLDIEITLPAHFIPDNSVVIKPRGTKEYILKSSIYIIPYIENGDEFIKNDPVEVIGNENTFFLVPKNSPYNSNYEIINSDKPLRWVLEDGYEFEKLVDFFKLREEGLPK